MYTYKVERFQSLEAFEKRLNEIQQFRPEYFVGVDDAGWWAVLVHQVWEDKE